MSTTLIAAPGARVGGFHDEAMASTCSVCIWFDTLPLSSLSALAGRHDVPVPGPLLAPLYRLRTRTVGFEFRYDLNARRFHTRGILDGSRALAALGYRPRHPVPSGARLAS